MDVFGLVFVCPMSVVIFEIYLYFCIFFRPTGAQVFGLTVVQVAGTLAKALWRAVLRDYRPRDHSAGYPKDLGA